MERVIAIIESTRKGEGYSAIQEFEKELKQIEKFVYTKYSL